jgi:hypothetical protein
MMDEVKGWRRTRGYRTGEREPVYVDVGDDNGAGAFHPHGVFLR